MFVDDHRELVNARRAGDVSQDGVHLFGSLHQWVELVTYCTQKHDLCNYVTKSCVDILHAY